MNGGMEGIRGMLIRPLISRLDEVEPELLQAEKKEFVTLVEEYFGASVRNRPVKAQFRSLVDKIGKRLTEEGSPDE